MDEWMENTQPIQQKLYLCDPDKNPECRKTICYKRDLEYRPHGTCMYTTDPAKRKNGKVFFYNQETGRIEEVKK